jgi:hypothetical protein
MRLRKFKIAFGTAIVAAATCLYGCGDGTSTTASVTRPVLASTPVQTSSSRAIEELEAANPSFVVAAKTPGGDRVRVEGHLSSPMTPEESGLDASLLQGCGGDGRELLVRLKVTAKLESSLAASIKLEGLRPGSLGVGADGQLLAANFLIEDGGGLTCESKTSEDAVGLGLVRPQSSVQATVWIMLPGAVTPNAPHPSEKQLEGWTMEVPTLSINGSPDREVSPGNGEGGPAMISCQEANPIITIAGTPLSKWTDSAGQNYPCSSVPAP